MAGGLAVRALRLIGGVGERGDCGYAFEMITKIQAHKSIMPPRMLEVATSDFYSMCGKFVAKCGWISWKSQHIPPGSLLPLFRFPFLRCPFSGGVDILARCALDRFAVTMNNYLKWTAAQCQQWHKNYCLLMTYEWMWKCWPFTCASLAPFNIKFSLLTSEPKLNAWHGVNASSQRHTRNK